MKTRAAIASVDRDIKIIKSRIDQVDGTDKSQLESILKTKQRCLSELRLLLHQGFEVLDSDDYEV